jgi:hypothetical protein
MDGPSFDMQTPNPDPAAHGLGAGMMGEGRRRTRDWPIRLHLVLAILGPLVVVLALLAIAFLVQPTV